jgi:hypothetical protein
LSGLEEIRAEADGLFELYRKLEARRIAEYRAGGSPLQIETNKAVDHFILYVALHQLVRGNTKGYRERKELLVRRLSEGVGR